MKYRNEWIPEPDAVYVVLPCLTDEFSGSSVTTQKTIQNGRLDPHARHDLFGARTCLV
jgi:hypothetical protein